MKTGISILATLHALVHLMGFAQAFGIQQFEEITKHITKPMGILWMLAGIVLLSMVITWSVRWDYWWVLAWTGILLSQVLIIYYWNDARFGTLFNVLILTASVSAFSSNRMHRQYLSDVNHGMTRNQNIKTKMITKEDIQHLPVAVQNYMMYTGVIGKPSVYNMKVDFDIQMRARGRDWFEMKAEQHSFFDQKERFFYLDAKVKGLPTKGYHRYKDDTSSMKIKLLSAIPIVNKDGEEMFEAETVTMFNDMCLMAPASLTDERIEWQTIDDLTVKAIFTNQGVSITALLYFNEKGQLVNFISDDRWDINAMRQYRFSTPVSEYREFNGYKLPSYGEAIWHYPEGEFVYGKFTMKNIQYNVVD